MALPQGLIDHLEKVQSDKESTDSAEVVATADEAAATLAAARAAASRADVVTKTAKLDTSREQVEALIDAYFRPGARPPAPPEPTPSE